MKKMYGGVNGEAAQIKKLYGGVNGEAVKIKKVYVGVNGYARQVYQSEKTIANIGRCWGDDLDGVHDYYMLLRLPSQEGTLILMGSFVAGHDTDTTKGRNGIIGLIVNDEEFVNENDYKVNLYTNSSHTIEIGNITVGNDSNLYGYYEIDGATGFYQCRGELRIAIKNYPSDDYDWSNQNIAYSSTYGCYYAKVRVTISAY